MKIHQELLISVVIGLTTALIVISIGFILDKYLSGETSNLIALIIGLLCNYIMQDLVFDKKFRSFKSKVFRYIIADTIILTSNQYMMTYLIQNEDKFKDYLPDNLQSNYLSVCRIFVGFIVWIVISFPIRKYWVYNHSFP